MTNLTTWEQAAQFDPTNPNQIARIYYAGLPGGYSSYYYNKVPTTAKLSGLNGLGFSFSGMPSFVQMLFVGALGLAAGYYGRLKLWPMVKPKLGLSGRRRSRR